MSYSRILSCRICGNDNLVRVLDLGQQMLTGVFPSSTTNAVTTGPISLVKCHGENDVCGLLQLEHSYAASEMYGNNYGYRSGLNPSMVAHLHRKVGRIMSTVNCGNDDLILDIGSNDSTTLQAYPADGPTLVGIDPTGTKFQKHYPAHVNLIPEFFSSEIFFSKYPGRNAKVVTSFSMFYDLDDPLKFMRDIRDVLADDGVWVFEQSYMPFMLDTNSYDTVCHEHLEFYALSQIKWMTDRNGLKILDVEFNDINGGSFSVTVAKDNGDNTVPPAVQQILEEEQRRKLHTLEPFRDFSERIETSKRELLRFIREVKGEGKRIVALGASTKGNVLLQYCELSPNDIDCVGEVNEEKFGRLTPGSWIPIVDENSFMVNEPDYFLILPWHFRRFFVENRKWKKAKLVFPLPKLEIV